MLWRIIGIILTTAGACFGIMGAVSLSLVCFVAALICTVIYCFKQK